MPFTDITTVNAVQSLFAGTVRDPWAESMAGALADLFVYSDVIRYALPVPSGSYRSPGLFKEPSLLVDLARRNPDTLRPAEYSTAEPRLLSDEKLEVGFTDFAAWARNNWRRRLLPWLQLHNEPWIRDVQRGRAQHDYIFSLEALERDPRLASLAQELGTTEENILYAFDIIVRYPLYGELAGADEWYLNHPIRDAFTLPTMEIQAGPPPQIPITFADSITAIAPSLTQDEYSSLLHDLRGFVRTEGIIKLRPGQLDEKELREIGRKFMLQPRLKDVVKAVGVTSGVIAGLGAFPALGPVAAVAGAVISIGAAYWSTGRLPRSLARVKWLRWALKYDIEDQADKRH